MTTGILLGALVLTNAFAAVDLAVGIVLIAILQPPGSRLRSLALLAGIGAAAYLWISPILTPDLVRTIRTDSLLLGRLSVHAAGDPYRPPGAGGRCSPSGISPAAGSTGSTALPFSSPTFSWPWSCWPISPRSPSCRSRSGITWKWKWRSAWPSSSAPATCWRWRAPGACRRRGAVRSRFWPGRSVWYRDYAAGLIRSIDITRTIQYKTAKWIDANLKGLRTMVSGDVGTWFNVFTDNPQLSSGHEPFSPNWMVQIATYTIYSGENAGDRDAEYSILWLKAYGCHAITVPGPQSREAYQPFRNPRKFEGVLPLLWHDEDDSIYAVPQRSTSLAHVIPADAVVVRPPIHGLDVPEVTRFVAAMEDPALPLADFSWQSEHARPHRHGGASRPGGRGAGDLRSGMGRRRPTAGRRR